MHGTAKHCVDCASAIAGMTTALGYLPVVLGCIASAFSIAWFVLQFINFYRDRNE